MEQIPLTKGKFALVDDEDFEWLNQWKWHTLLKKNGKCYAARTATSMNVKTYVLMHREILKTPAGMLTDHKDGNGLNNQRDNIRVCTNLQNCMNKRARGGISHYKGVFLVRTTKKWIAQIGMNNKAYHLGTFDTQEEAARAYDAAARIYFKEFARPNFKEVVNE